jgi:hypothetical protein
MKQITENDELQMIVPFAGWLDRHPTAASIILWIMILALVYVVFTYEFTIPAYQ